MTGWFAELWRAVWGSADATDDGYGQSWLDELRASVRFRALKKQRLAWRPPGDWPGDAMTDFPLLAKFGDGIVAYWREGDEDWFIIDRIWHGWPDPPEFAFLAFDAQRRIVTACDFNDWPATWTRPQA